MATNILSIVLYVVALIVAISIQCAIFCCGYGRRVPTNYYLLAGFTACFTYIVAVICAMTLVEYTNGLQLIIMALVMTAGVTIGLTFVAWTTDADFTRCGPICCMLTIIMFIMFIFLILTDNPFIHILYCILGIIIYSGYILIDTQLIIGGKRYQISEDDYVIACMALYIDINQTIRLLLLLLLLLMLLNYQEESDWWHRIFPKDNEGAMLLLKEASLSKKVIFLRKLFLLFLYSQLGIVAMFLILTSNVTWMQFIAEKDETNLVLVAIICFLCITILYFLYESILRKYPIVFIWILNSIFVLVFSYYGCQLILKDPTQKWHLFLFLVANIFYMFGFICLTFKEKWHNSLFITYICYTIIYIWTMLGLAVLIVPNVDIRWLSITVLWIFCAGFYITTEVNLIVRNWRDKQITTNDSDYCAFLIQFDFIIVLVAILNYLAKCAKFMGHNN